MTAIRVRIIKPKNEKVAANTAYYRNNKKNRLKVHNCPHCNYETTGPKCILINHINAKHTQNTNKPFQCLHCSKGFSQKAHLQNHLIKKHNIPEHIAKPPVQSKNIFVYLITLTGKKAKSKTTIARLDIYKRNPKLFTEELKTLTVNGKQLVKPHNLHYDAKQEYISLKTMTEHEYKALID